MPSLTKKGGRWFVSEESLKAFFEPLAQHRKNRLYNLIKQ